MLSYHPLSSQNPYYGALSSGFLTYQGDSPLVLQSIMSTYIWSPIIWEGGIRKKTNFSRSDYLVLDMENIEVSLEEFNSKTACDMWRIIGITRNHQKEKDGEAPLDRFRVLMRWNRPITCMEEYEHNVRIAVNLYGSDEKCIDAARPFFPCTKITHYHPDNELYDWDVEVIDPKVIEEKRAKLEARYRRIDALAAVFTPSAFARKWLAHPIPVGKRNSTIFGVCCDLFRANYLFDQVLKLILASPTCANGAMEEKEIKKITASAYRKVEKECVVLGRR